MPPHDKGVIEQVRATRFQDIRWDANEALIETVGSELDEKYTDMIAGLSLSNAGKTDLNIVFTALHGTSIISVPPALAKAGFTNVQLVEAQSTPDGNFPTVASPNRNRFKCRRRPCPSGRGCNGILLHEAVPERE